MRLAPSVILLATLALGCTERRGIHPDASFGDAGAAHDAASPIDAHVSVDAGRDARAMALDTGRDAASGGGLDPQLDVPPATNATCTSPSSLSECSGIAVCRFYSATEGRCEGCSACGNLFASCTSGQDCDILFVCYQGQCTNFCMLGTSECGAPSDCIDVGHAGEGVCRPH